jgi:hypothetical protein
LACKPDSVIGALVPFSSVASFTADSLQTVTGTGQPAREGQIHQDERQGVPHPAVRMRDGSGLAGPLVISGVFASHLPL